MNAAFEALDKEMSEPMKTKILFRKNSEAPPGDAPTGEVGEFHTGVFLGGI